MSNIAFNADKVSVNGAWSPSVQKEICAILKQQCCICIDSVVSVLSVSVSPRETTACFDENLFCYVYQSVSTVICCVYGLGSLGTFYAEDVNGKISLLLRILQEAAETGWVHPALVYCSSMLSRAINCFTPQHNAITKQYTAMTAILLSSLAGPSLEEKQDTNNSQVWTDGVFVTSGITSPFSDCLSWLFLPSAAGADIKYP